MFEPVFKDGLGVSGWLCAWDIAAACAFFVSEEAGYITGQILGVNGGRNT